MSIIEEKKDRGMDITNEGSSSNLLSSSLEYNPFEYGSPRGPSNLNSISNSSSTRTPVPGRWRFGEPLSRNSSNVSFDSKGNATLVNVDGSNGSRNTWSCTKQRPSRRGGRRSKRIRRNKRTKRRGSMKRRGSKRRR